MGDDDLKQLIAELEAAFKSGNSRLSVYGHILIAVPFAFVVNYLHGVLLAVWGIDRVTSFFLAPVVYIVALWISGLAAKPQTEWLKKQLVEDGLIAGVLRGDVPGTDITQCTPWPVSYFLLLPRIPSRLTDPFIRRLWKIGYNLDWYLNPVRSLFRPAWIAMVWLLILSVVLCIALFKYQFPVGAAPWLTATALISSIIPSFIVGHDAIRRHQWTNLLLKHLQTMQEPTGDQSAAVS